MSFLERIHTANRHDIRKFLPFCVAGVNVGYIKHTFAAELNRWPKVFAVDDREVRLAPALNTPDVAVETRSAAVAEVLRQLHEERVIPSWRDELYAVNRFFTEQPVLLMERAAIPLFGICGYGVHMNGFVRQEDDIRMWIGKRSSLKPVSPGKLDQLVAGGQPAGMSLRENMIKECKEEANIPPELTARMKPVGAISYCLETEQGLRPDVIYCFDLELPPEFVPVNNDGEVEAFYLWSMDRVIEVARDTDDFKFNCNLVVIDFLIRHGFIAPEDPDYLAIIAGLVAREWAPAFRNRTIA